MCQFETASISEPYRESCQDRVAVFSDLDRVVIVVADGAGGTGSGEQAAATVVDEIRSGTDSADSASAWCDVLRQADERISLGESTGVVVDVRPDRICGASVGDSQAWIVRGAEIVDLTQRQRRKPLLGSREATPVGFTYQSLDGLLIVASDGFCNYVKREAMVKVLPYEDFAVIPKRLLEMVRLRSGELWDDVGIAVCRYRPRLRRHPRRYAIGIEDLM